jgi:hypothetical protein
VTTVNDNAIAVVKLAKMHGKKFPIVVVGDVKGPANSSLICILSSVHCITLEKQLERFPKLVSLTPLKYFGRKNFVYLYAIQLGACNIWDFDDDNVLTNGNFFNHKLTFSVPLMMVPNVAVSKRNALNPYMLFGADRPA